MIMLNQQQTKIIEQAQVMAEKDAEIERLRTDVELLLWNLAGCSTIATMERPTDFNKEMARPALHDVNDLAKKYQDSRAEIERLRTALEELTAAAGCIRYWHDAMPDNSGMVVSADNVRKLWNVLNQVSAALGEAGKEKPDTCVWTVNVTENSWILGCDESKDTSAPPKVCPYCKKRVEVRG